MMFSLDQHIELSFDNLVEQHRHVLLLRRKRYLLSDTIEDAEYEVITQ